MKRLLRLLGPVVVLCIFVAVAWLLYGKLRHFPYSAFEEGLREIAPVRVAAAVGLTGLYYLILVAYDFLAVRYVGFRLPLPKIALASFTGYASSYNFGVLLGGAPVRYRLYTLWGLSAVKILEVIVILALTFWIGVFTLGGIVFLAEPLRIPAELHLPVAHAWKLGLAMLLVLAAYFGLCASRRGRPLKLWGRRFRLPPLRMGLVQAATASADLLSGAGVFFVLVAPILHGSYWSLLGVYLLSLVAGITTQVPGGIGVFELLVLELLNPINPPKLVAAMVVWRAAFYLLPLAIAAVLLGAHEVWLRAARRRNTRP